MVLQNSDEDCEDCIGKTFHFEAARPGFMFNDAVQKLIHLLKYRDLPAVGTYLGRATGKIVAHEPWFPHIDCFMPVPLHNTRRRERGYNQCDLIADGIAAGTEIPVYKNLIVRSRHTMSQTKLTPEERLENVNNVFYCRDSHDLRNRVVGLVDDVFTTGATLDSCSKVLLEHGVKEVFAITIARA